MLKFYFTFLFPHNYRDQRLRELLIDLEHPRFSTPVFTSSEHADLIGNLNISQQEAIDKVIHYDDG